VLVVPDLVMAHHVVPAGRSAMERRPGVRRLLEDVMLYDHDDMSKYMSTEGMIEFLRELRGLTRPRYHAEPKRSE
jgi:hypothetical protein